MDQVQRLDGVAGLLADHIQLALQRIGGFNIVAAADEDLTDHRLGRTHGGRHRHFAIDRHIAPAQHDLSLSAYRAIDFLFAGDARSIFLGQEDHAHTVFTKSRQAHALLRHLFAVELVGNLDQNTRTVTHQLVCTHRAAMVYILQDEQTLLDDLVALLPFDMRNKTDAAGIMFVSGIIETLLLRCAMHYR